MNEIFRRVSIRSFLPQDVEEEKLDALLRAAMQAPSSKNQRPWEFVVVRDAALRKKLGEASRFTAPAGRAPVCIALLYNERRAELAELCPLDLAAATENLLLEAVHQGLGAVWLCVFPRQERMAYVAEALNLPPHVKPFALVPVGYALHPRPAQGRYDPSRIHRDGYPAATDDIK